MKKYIEKERIIYTLSFISVAIIIILALVINGKTFVQSYDGYDQYYPAFLYIGRYLRGILAGKFQLYDFTIGFGEDIIESLNWDGFGDPINLLAVFATQNNGYIVYAIAVLLKLYLSGTGMMNFLRYHHCDGILSVGGGIVYAFSLYSMLQGMFFPVFLNTVWILPYLLVQLEKLIRNDYSSDAITKFVILLALQTCSGGFYFSYIQSLFLVLYAIIVYCNEFQNIFSIKFLKKFIQILKYYFLGIMVAGIIFFPAIHSFLSSSRSLGGDFGWHLIWDKEMLFLLFNNLFVPVYSIDDYGLALPVVCAVAIAGCIMTPKLRKELGIATFLLALMYVCPTFWRITNGFSYPGNRWIYVIYFWVAYITVRVMEDCIKGNIKRSVFIAAFLVIIISVLYHYIKNGDKIRCVVPLCYVVILGFWGMRNHLTKKKAFLLIVSGVWLNVFFLYANWRICGYDLYTVFRDKEDVINISDTELDKTVDEQWKRIEVDGNTANDGLVKGYPGTAEYLSLLNGNVSQFYQDFLISPGITGGSFVLSGLDGRIALEAILSVEQYDDNIVNPYKLPLGVVYTETIGYSQFMKLTPVERQRVILEYMIVDDGGTVENERDVVDEDDIKSIPFEIEYVDVTRNGDEVIAESNGQILLKIDKTEVPEKCEIYVFFSDFESHNGSWNNVEIGKDKHILVSDPQHIYFFGLNDYLVKVFTDDGEINITFPDSINKLSLNDIKVFYYDTERVEESIDKLKDNFLQDAIYSSDRIEGNIDIKQESYLFFNIPYHTGWKVYVNGKREKLVKANIGFMAVKLTEGNHNIVLKYDSLWNKMGLYSTIVGLIGLMLVRKLKNW